MTNEEITALLNDTAGSAQERVDAVLRPGVLPDGIRVAVAETIVARAVARAAVLSYHSIRDWAVRWLSGEDRTHDSASAQHVWCELTAANGVSLAEAKLLWAAADVASAASRLPSGAVVEAARACSWAALSRAPKGTGWDAMEAERRQQLDDILTALQSA